MPTLLFALQAGQVIEVELIWRFVVKCGVRSILVVKDAIFSKPCFASDTLS